jgi:hypothetical protein
MIEIPERAILEEIAKLASESGDQTPISPNSVAVVLQAYINVYGGDSVGTLLRDPESGTIAHRVKNESGLHMWRISDPAGVQYNDMQPHLAGWEKIG